MDWRDNTRYAVFTRRAAVLSAGTIGLFGGLLSRMYYLQISKADEYAKLAEENRVNTRLLAPPRGRLLDRFGVDLATNRQNFRVYLIPEQAKDVERVLGRLVALVPRIAAERPRIAREVARNRSFVPVTVVENLTWEEFATLNIHAPDLPGVRPDVGETRDYPFGADLAHVVGYVAKVAENDLEDDPMLRLPGFRIGKSGIERTVDRQLRGQAGKSRVEVNAYGRVIRELSRHEGTPGDDAILTLDMGVQRFAAERVRGESAAVVVLDVANGEVLALVSAPGFDPNAFNVGLTDSDWKALTGDPLKPLINKAIQGQYPPGSTFKMVTALAALAAGVVKPEERVFCRAEITLGTHKFHCWKKGGHGWVDLKNGLKHSCDIYFYELAKRTGVDRIAEMARKLGLGSDYDFELANTKSGIVPTSGWKLATTGVTWQQGETLITGIGQGFILTTPLQLAVMVARIANGRVAVRPHLLRSVGPDALARQESPPLDIKDAHLAMVRAGMNAVTNEAGGTAFRSRITDLDGISLAGKTGTAQVRRISKAERLTGVIKNEDLPWEQRDHALFVAFAPVDEPRYGIAVIVEHGGSGSKTAGPIARDIMRETLILDPAGRPPLAPLGPVAELAKGERS